MMTLFTNLAHQVPATGGRPRSFSASITRATDIDEFVETVRGYRISFMQIDQGPFAAESMQIQFGGVLLTAAQYERAVVHSGEPPAGTITFAVQTSAAAALWQGREFGPHDLLVGRAGVEIDLVTQPGFSVATASFPLDLVEKVADRFGWTRSALATTSSIVSLKQSEAQELRTALTAVFNEVVARPFDDRVATWILSKQEELLRVLFDSKLEPLRPMHPESTGERARVLRAALVAINDMPEDVLTIGDLCRIARASERTLHYAFAERFGLPPAHYMKAHRLNGARKDLRGGDSSLTKISDVANKWGFWHLGQFAKDYRNWFGELPSHTYRRTHIFSRVE